MRSFKPATAPGARAIAGLVTRGSATSALSVAAALIIALATTAIVLLVLGADPIVAFDGIVTGAFGSRQAITQTLLVTTPLALCALAAAVPFSARVINVGGDGQLLAGAVGATAVGFWLSGAPAGLLVVLGCAAGLACGAAWALVAGALKALLNANEVIVTLMLNFIALLVVDAAISGAWADPIAPQTRPLPAGMELPTIWSGSSLNLGIAIAVVAAVVAWVLMRRSALGFGIRVTGLNPSAARLRGYEIRRITLAVFAIGGAFAGLAGSIEVIGKHQALVGGISANFGFMGVALALVARLSPLWTLPVALLFAAVSSGSNTLQATVGVSTSASLVVLSSFVLALLALGVIRTSRGEAS